MYDDQNGQTPRMWANLKREMQKNWQLWWRLFTHPRVSILAKAMPVLALLYWLNPLDFPTAPLLGMTPIDDAAAVLLGLKLFVELSPQDVVAAIRHEIEYGTPSDDEVIDASYRVLDDE